MKKGNNGGKYHNKEIKKDKGMSKRDKWQLNFNRDLFNI